jgi:hypothetical protein
VDSGKTGVFPEKPYDKAGKMNSLSNKKYEACP